MNRPGRLNMFRIVAALGALLLSLAVYSAGLDEEEKLSLARDAVESYFEALSAGDVEQLGELLVGRYGDSRKRIMGHAGYDERLREAYSGARFDINELELSTSTEAVALTTMDLSGEEQSQVRLFLRLTEAAEGPQYRIYDEAVVGTVY